MTNKTEEATDGKAVEGKADAAGKCKPKPLWKLARKLLLKGPLKSLLKGPQKSVLKGR